jgi:hypothetical protein
LVERGAIVMKDPAAARIQRALAPSSFEETT